METNRLRIDDTQYSQELRKYARKLRQESTQTLLEAKRRRQEAEERLKSLITQWHRAENYFFESLEKFDQQVAQR